MKNKINSLFLDHYGHPQVIRFQLFVTRFGVTSDRWCLRSLYEQGEDIEDIRDKGGVMNSYLPPNFL